MRGDYVLTMHRKMCNVAVASRLYMKGPLQKQLISCYPGRGTIFMYPFPCDTLELITAHALTRGRAKLKMLRNIFCISLRTP